jgi:hypothetical protein
MCYVFEKCWELTLRILTSKKMTMWGNAYADKPDLASTIYIHARFIVHTVNITQFYLSIKKYYKKNQGSLPHLQALFKSEPVNNKFFPCPLPIYQSPEFLYFLSSTAQLNKLQPFHIQVLPS